MGAGPAAMPPPRILVTRRIPEAGLAPLAEAGAQVTVLVDEEDRGPDVDTLRAAVAGADALLCQLTDGIDRALLEVAPRLRGVAQMAVGHDNIDLAAATELGVPVSNTPGVLTETSADCTWAMLMAVARRVVEADRYVREGRFRLWGPTLMLGADVGLGPEARPKVLGIVGFGRIGRAVARRASGFDMEVLAYDPFNRDAIEADPLARPADLGRLLERSDFVTVHAPLLPSTRHLIADHELRSMKPTAFLINAARGPIVDEAALVRALRERRIAGAALDVYENEPQLTPGLAELDNVVLLPHIASASRDTRDKMARIAARNALCHARAERAPQAVNPEVYDGGAWRARTGGAG